MSTRTLHPTPHHHPSSSQPYPYLSRPYSPFDSDDGYDDDIPENDSQLTHHPLASYTIADPQALLSRMSASASHSPAKGKGKMLDKFGSLGKKVVKEVLGGTGNNPPRIRPDLIPTYGRGGAARPKVRVYGATPMPLPATRSLGAMNQDTFDSRVPGQVDTFAGSSASSSGLHRVPTSRSPDPSATTDASFRFAAPPNVDAGRFKPHSDYPFGVLGRKAKNLGYEDEDEDDEFERVVRTRKRPELISLFAHSRTPSRERSLSPTPTTTLHEPPLPLSTKPKPRSSSNPPPTLIRDDFDFLNHPPDTMHHLGEPTPSTSRRSSRRLARRISTATQTSLTSRPRTAFTTTTARSFHRRPPPLQLGAEHVFFPRPQRPEQQAYGSRLLDRDELLESRGQTPAGLVSEWQDDADEGAGGGRRKMYRLSSEPVPVELPPTPSSCSSRVVGGRSVSVTVTPGLTVDERGRSRVRGPRRPVSIAGTFGLEESADLPLEPIEQPQAPQAETQKKRRPLPNLPNAPTQTHTSTSSLSLPHQLHASHSHGSTHSRTSTLSQSDAASSSVASANALLIQNALKLLVPGVPAPQPPSVNVGGVVNPQAAALGAQTVLGLGGLPYVLPQPQMAYGPMSPLGAGATLPMQQAAFTHQQMLSPLPTLLSPQMIPAIQQPQMIPSIQQPQMIPSIQQPQLIPSIQQIPTIQQPQMITPAAGLELLIALANQNLRLMAAVEQQRLDLQQAQQERAQLEQAQQRELDLQQAHQRGLGVQQAQQESRGGSGEGLGLQTHETSSVPETSSSRTRAVRSSMLSTSTAPSSSNSSQSKRTSITNHSQQTPTPPVSPRTNDFRPPSRSPARTPSSSARTPSSPARVPSFKARIATPKLGRPFKLSLSTVLGRESGGAGGEEPPVPPLPVSVSEKGRKKSSSRPSTADGVEKRERGEGKKERPQSWLAEVRGWEDLVLGEGQEASSSSRVPESLRSPGLFSVSTSTTAVETPRNKFEEEGTALGFGSAGKVPFPRSRSRAGEMQAPVGFGEVGYAMRMGRTLSSLSRMRLGREEEEGVLVRDSMDSMDSTATSNDDAMDLEELSIMTAHVFS